MAGRTRTCRRALQLALPVLVLLRRKLTEWKEGGNSQITYSAGATAPRNRGIKRKLSVSRLVQWSAGMFPNSNQLPLFKEKEREGFVSSLLESSVPRHTDEMSPRVSSAYLASLTQTTWKCSSPCSTMSAGLNAWRYARVSVAARTMNELQDSLLSRLTVLPCSSRIPLFPVGRLCMALPFKTHSSVPRTAYPCAPSHSTAAGANTGGHAVSFPDTKAAEINSGGKWRGNNSKRTL